MRRDEIEASEQTGSWLADMLRRLYRPSEDQGKAIHVAAVTLHYDDGSDFTLKRGNHDE